MTLLWAPGVVEALASLRNLDLPDDAYGRLIQRLIRLENDASLFEATEAVVHVRESDEADAVGPLMSHVMEAHPGSVFVIYYRLAVSAEDVWIVGLRYGQ